MEPVRSRFRAKLGFVPDGKFHRHRLRHARFLTAPAQPGPEEKSGPVIGQVEVIRSIVIAPVETFMGGPAHDQVKRDQIARIEEVEDVGGSFDASPENDSLLRKTPCLISA